MSPDRRAWGAAGKIPETPKPDDPLFGRVKSVMVASNIQALEAARAVGRMVTFG